VGDEHLEVVLRRQRLLNGRRELPAEQPRRVVELVEDLADVARLEADAGGGVGDIASRRKSL